jgi:vacuolar-type H+-ATPase subunit B/Vma2
MSTSYRTGRYASGPLLIFERVRNVGLGEIATITAPDGSERLAQVLELQGEHAVVQVLRAGFDGARAARLADGRIACRPGDDGGLRRVGAIEGGLGYPRPR